MFIAQISPEVQQTFHNPQVLELTLSRSHLPVENVAHFLQLKHFSQQFFIPPGTHYCWVDRGGVDSKLGHGFLHLTSAAGIEPQTTISGPTP